MFDLGWSELLVVGIVALIVIGPKELPGVLRMAGQWIGKVRRMASDFQGQFQEAMREAEMADLKKEVDEFTQQTDDLTASFNPLETVRSELDDVNKSLDDTSSAIAAAAAERPDPVETDAGAQAQPEAECAVAEETSALSETNPPPNGEMQRADAEDERNETRPAEKAAAGGAAS